MFRGEKSQLLLLPGGRRKVRRLLLVGVRAVGYCPGCCGGSQRGEGREEEREGTKEMAAVGFCNVTEGFLQCGGTN